MVRQSGYLAPDMGISIAGDILEARPLPPEFTRLAPALIRQAAIFSPFDRETIRLASEITQQTANPPFAKWVKTALSLTDSEPVPDNIPYPDTKSATSADFIMYMKAQKANVNRLPILLHLWQTGQHSELLQAINIMASSPSGPLAAPLLAWGAYSIGQPDIAPKLLDEGVENFLALNLRARIALDDGQLGLAITNLIMSLDHEPFQPAVIEMLAELTTRTPADELPHPGNDTHICLYTWNKPDLLAQTVASLANTEIGQARVTILNNGTTDCSPKDLEQRVKQFAPNLTTNFIHLPINIGAPAARNWLLALPEVQKSKYVAFLDDDVILPKQWLKRYINTLEAFPNATVVGPKCINIGVQTIQYAFRSFQEIGENKIRFTANAPTLMDMGQFDTARPSLTVMGCCHLFHMERMNALNVPDFDIRFSPSQVDDIEHDLQIWKAGGQVIYDGEVPVIHLQNTGKAQTSASIGQAYGNHYKMENKFTLAELEHMDKTMRWANVKHFKAALDAVMPIMPDPANKFWKLIGV
jgi:GT2 family glycosyltransferase